MFEHKHLYLLIISLTTYKVSIMKELSFISNQFKRRLASGERLHGLWLSSCSPIVADAIRDAGYDWALIDMEHSINSTATVAELLRCFRDSKTTPIVRPPFNEPVEVKRLLDIGVRNFLFPLVHSAEEAKMAIQATRYKSVGGLRGVSLGQSANHFGRIRDYFDRANDDVTVIVQVETKSAIDQIAAIAAVDGVDGIFVGPADLSDDLKKTGRTFDDEVQKHISRMLELCKKAKKPAGTLIFNEELAQSYYTRGFSFVSCASDLSLLCNAADTQAAKFANSLAALNSHVETRSEKMLEGLVQ